MKPSKKEKKIGGFLEKLAWSIAMNIMFKKYVVQWKRLFEKINGAEENNF